MIESSLLHHLQADPTLARLIAKRYYPLLPPPEATFPCISFQLFKVPNDNTLDGFGGIITATVNLHCVALTYLETKEVAQALFRRMRDFRGSMGDEDVQLIVFESEDDDYIPPETGEEKPELFFSTQVYSVSYTVM